MSDLKNIIPINEENKKDWINWLGSTLDIIDNRDDMDYTTHRVFNTDNDDVDEARNVLGSIFLTLQKFTLVPIDQTVQQQCPDCKVYLDVDLSTGTLKLNKHTI